MWFRRLALATTVVAVASAPGAAQPRPPTAIATTAVDLAPSAVVAGASGDQWLPSVASHGGAYVAVWQDAASTDFKVRPLVRFARLGTDGTAREAPHTIGDVWRNTPAFPQVASCGDRVLVAWQDEYSVRVARIEVGGKDVRQEVVARKATPATHPLPAIACAGTTALVAWAEGAQGQIHAAVIDRDAPLALSPIAISKPDKRAQWPRIASDGVGFLVLWQSHDGTHAVVMGSEVTSERGTVRSTGAVTLTPGVDVTEGDYGAVEVGRRTYAIAYASARGTGGVFTTVVRFPSGTVSTPASVHGGAPARVPRLVRGGGGPLALWISSTHGAGAVMGAPLDRTGKPVGKPRIVTPKGHDTFAFGAAASLRDVLLAWGHGPPAQSTGGLPSGTDVWLARLVGDGTTAASPTRLTTGGAVLSSPAVASNGDGFLWAWIDDGQLPRRLRFSRVRPDGALLDDPGVVVGVLDGVNLRQPAVTSDGSDYLVTWNDRGVFAVRVDRNGRVLDPKPIVVAPATPSYDVSFDGSSYIVVYPEQRSIHAVRVGVDGRVAAPVVVQREAHDSSEVSIDCAPASCLVVWPYHNNAYGFTSIVGRRLIDGAPEIAGQYGRAYSPSNGHRSRPEVEWTGTEYRIAWIQNEHRFGVTADLRGLITTRPQPLGTGLPPRQRATTKTGLALDVDVAASRVVGRLRAGPRPVAVRPAAPAAPVALATLFARVRAIAAGTAWKSPGWRDADLETTLARLIGNLDAVTSRGVAPLELAEVIPGRTPAKPRPNIEFGGSSVTVRDASGKAKLTGQLVVDRGGSYQSADRAVVLSDGDLRIGYVKDSIIIATGNVDLAHVDRSVVIAGGFLEISHEGGDFEYGRGHNSILLTSSQLSISFTRGAVIGAADGAKVGALSGGVAINTPGIESLHTPAVVLSDAKPATVRGKYDVAVGTGDAPRVALFDAGAATPVAFGFVDWPLEFPDRRLRASHPLAGWRVVSASPRLVVLGRGHDRLRLTPIENKAVTFPADPPIGVQVDTVVHGVGIYEPIRARGPVTVNVENLGAPVVLVLTSYEAARWNVVLAPGTALQGVILIGYGPQSVDGVPEGVPVVLRVHAFGQPGHYGYVDKSGKPSDGFQRLRDIVAALGYSSFTSFRGNYHGERFTITRGSSGMIHVPQP